MYGYVTRSFSEPKDHSEWISGCRSMLLVEDMRCRDLVMRRSCHDFGGAMAYAYSCQTQDISHGHRADHYTLNDIEELRLDLGMTVGRQDDRAETPRYPCSGLERGQIRLWARHQSCVEPFGALETYPTAHCRGSNV
jgi:hypothetical protein